MHGEVFEGELPSFTKAGSKEGAESQAIIDTKAFTDFYSEICTTVTVSD